jgi:hypothetical protein
MTDSSSTPARNPAVMTNIRPVPFEQQRALCEFYVWNVLDLRAPALRTNARGLRVVPQQKSHMTVIEKNCGRCGVLFARWYTSKSVADSTRHGLKYCDGFA